MLKKIKTCNENDFVIENCVLVKYNGNDGDVIIPEGI